MEALTGHLTKHITDESRKLTALVEKALELGHHFTEKEIMDQSKKVDRLIIDQYTKEPYFRKSGIKRTADK